MSVDPRLRENIRLTGPSQLTPPAKVPSSPTCSSPERGGEGENSLYEAGGGMYGKQYRAGVVEWGGAQYGDQTGYQPPSYQCYSQPGQLYNNTRNQERVILVKNEPQVWRYSVCCVVTVTPVSPPDRRCQD